MKITKAVITAAARNQRTLPLQTLVDVDGVQKPVIGIIIEEARRAGITDTCVVVCPGDETGYSEALGGHSGRLHFVPQNEPLGYGHALYCARDFVGAEPFLHLVGDHVYVNSSGRSLAQQLVETAETHSCAVSGVKSTHESLLPYFGMIGGRRVKGSDDLYVIERVVEKPTPTEAEQSLTVPGLRAGHYLGFFGIHVLTPLVMDLLHDRFAKHGHPGKESRKSPIESSEETLLGRASEKIELSPVLDELASREQYLALQADGQRYPVDVRYGLLTAQLALALGGKDRDEVLVRLCELLAHQELDTRGGRP